MTHMKLKRMITKQPITAMIVSMVAGYVVLTITGLGAKLMEKVPFLSKYNV